MRHLRVRFLQEARSDLEDIYRSVLKVSQNEAIALGFYNRIYARCKRIGFVPFGGRRRDDLEPGLRTVPFEHSAIIAYKIESDRVEITNIFYGRRDYESFYLSSSLDDEDPESEL
jgi:toxin ParE1/3/4